MIQPREVRGWIINPYPSEIDLQILPWPTELQRMRVLTGKRFFYLAASCRQIQKSPSLGPRCLRGENPILDKRVRAPKNAIAKIGEIFMASSPDDLCFRLRGENPILDKRVHAPKNAIAKIGEIFMGSPPDGLCSRLRGENPILDKRVPASKNAIAKIGEIFMGASPDGLCFRLDGCQFPFLPSVVEHSL